MKTTKRFLSIVLMLAMLVSMFTVMAFADGESEDAEKKTISVEVVGKGKVQIKDSFSSQTKSFEAKSDDVLTAVPLGDNDTATWYGVKSSSPDTKLPGTTIDVREVASTYDSLKVVFSNSGDEPADEKHTLTIAVSPRNSGEVQYAGKAYTEMDDLEKGETRELTAVEKPGYQFVKWEVTEGDAELKYNTETTTVTMGDTDSTVTAVFERDDYYGDDVLYIDITNSSRGTVQFLNDNDVDSGDYFNLRDGKTYTIYATAKSGYTAYWYYNGTWDDGRSFKFTMDKDCHTLYVKFVEDGCRPDYDDDSHTLTIDITGEKHGTVKRGTTKIYDGYTMSLDKNDTRTFKATPDKGYVAVWTFRGESYVGNEFTVKMGSKNATLYIEFMDEDDYRLWNLPFRDVSERDWFYADVAYVYANGYMEGISSTKFAPNQNTTRAQIVTILWRLTGEPRPMKSNKFNDVSSKAYYDTAVSWAVEAGVVNGFDARTFKPNDYVTREQLAAILYRYAEYMNLSTRGASNLSNYNDYYKIGSWARDAMAWANYHGLINGVSYSRIDPKGYATRAQIAAILHRFAVEFGNY